MHGRVYCRKGGDLVGQEFMLASIRRQILTEEERLRVCNELTAQYGLTLSGGQIRELAERRFAALQDTGRVEFGEGILEKLIRAFCDSPYISQGEYMETLLALQDAFYYFKNESLERLSDDELIDYMKQVFDGRAQGSLEYLFGTSLEDLCREARGGERSEAEDDAPYGEE